MVHGKDSGFTDRGWAWVVVSAATICFMIVAGFVRGFGVFYSALVEEYGGSASITSLIQGFRFAALCISAPIASSLTERFSERTVLFGGTASFSLGLTLSFFAPNLEFNVFTLGVMTGVGMASILTPCQIAVGKYFDRYRSLANSIVFCGSSLGMMALPPLVMFLIEQYGLRGCLLVYGAVFLNCLACAALVRPLKVVNPKENENVTEGSGRHLPTTGDARDAPVHPMEDLPDPRKTAQLDLYPHVSPGDRPVNPEYTNASKRLGSQDRLPSEYCDYTLSNPDLYYTSLASLNCIDGSMYLRVGRRISDNEHCTDVKLETKTTSRSNSLCGWLDRILDFSLFRNARFMLLLLSTSFAMVSFANVTIYLIPRAEEYGISRERAALFLTVAGGCDIVGRLIIGAVSDVKKVGPHRVMMTGLFLIGTATLLLPLASNFNTMVVYVVVFGLIGSAGHMLCLPITVLFVGRERMPRGMGLVTSFHGIASAISPPFLGYIKDTTGTYDSTFYVCGGCQIVAAGLLLLEPMARRYDQRHRDKQSTSSGLT